MSKQKSLQVEKVYHTISEVARAIDRAPSTIRFWESEMPWIRPKKIHYSDRRYTAPEIENIKDVAFLIAEGMTVRGVQMLHDRGDLTIGKVIAALKKDDTKL